MDRLENQNQTLLRHWQNWSCFYTVVVCQLKIKLRTECLYKCRVSHFMLLLNSSKFLPWPTSPPLHGKTLNLSICQPNALTTRPPVNVKVCISLRFSTIGWTIDSIIYTSVLQASSQTKIIINLRQLQAFTSNNWLKKRVHEQHITTSHRRDEIPDNQTMLWAKLQYVPSLAVRKEQNAYLLKTG